MAEIGCIAYDDEERGHVIVAEVVHAAPRTTQLVGPFATPDELRRWRVRYVEAWQVKHPRLPVPAIGLRDVRDPVALTRELDPTADGVVVTW